jgi:hypothetical protein
MVLCLVLVLLGQAPIRAEQVYLQEGPVVPVLVLVLAPLQVPQRRYVQSQAQFLPRLHLMQLSHLLHYRLAHEFRLIDEQFLLRLHLHLDRLVK